MTHCTYIAKLQLPTETVKYQFTAKEINDPSNYRDLLLDILAENFGDHIRDVQIIEIKKLITHPQPMRNHDHDQNQPTTNLYH